MDVPSRSAQLALVRDFCARHSQAVLFDETGETLFDVAAAKMVPLRSADLAKVEERPNREVGGTYLVLSYGDGHELALSNVGVAFTPDAQHTGPIAELPPVVCFRDFTTLTSRLEHELYGHPDRPPTRETVRVLMMCLAILAGAKSVGFEISREERALERYLSEVEKRAPAGST